MNVTHLPQLVRNAGRFREVVTVLLKYGIAGWLEHVPAVWLRAQLRTRDGEVIAGKSFEVRVREAIEEIGTTFIKLGQILSTRPDIIGADLAEELAKLQSGTPADSYDEVSATIREEFGKAPEDMFDEFDDAALASGSIGQVHRAQLDGQPVVVKVVHAGIAEKIENDIEIILELARLAESYSRLLKQYQPVRVAKHFARVLRAELDFNREATNLEGFAANFAKDRTVRFPHCYRNASGRSVLTMDFLQGESLSAVAKRRSPAELKELARRGAEVFLAMVFRHGVFHADPHPGNLLVLRDNAIGVIDAGMVGRVDAELTEQLEDLLLAAIDQDAEGLVEIIVSLGDLPENFDRGRLRSDLADFVSRYTVQSMMDFDLRGALREVVSIIHAHHITLPEQAALLIKTLIVLEGTAQQLNPDFSLAELMGDHRHEILRRRISPRRLLRQLRTAHRDWTRLASILPGDLSDILHRLKQGRFDVHLDHRRLDTVVNRLVAGVLSAALFVGSSFLYAQRVPPCINDYSLPGVLGCLAAVGLGARVLRAIRQSGNLE